jgi:hypothetical protein
MLKMTPATAEAATAQTADADAFQAAMRPLAGFGAGAFVCEGAWAGSLFASPLFAGPLSDEMAALAWLGVRSAAGVYGTSAVGAGPAQAGVIGGAGKTSVIDVAQVDSAQRDNHNFIQTARLHPVTQGGVGPHPAREPEPV